MGVVESLKKENQRYSPILTFMTISTFYMDALRTWPHWQLFLLFLFLNISILVSINDKIEETIKDPNRMSALYLIVSISLNILLIYTIIDISIGLHYLLSVIVYLILFISSFMVVQNNLTKTNNISKQNKIVILIITITVLLFTINPLIQPINNKPEIDGYFYPYRFYFPNTSQLQEGLLFVKQSRGFSWDLNLSVFDSNNFDVYLDNRINGNKEWEYSKQSEEKKIPIQIYCPGYIEKGVYTIKFQLTYLDYFSDLNFEYLTLSIFVEEEGPPPVQYPWFLGVVSSIIAMVVVYYARARTRRTRNLDKMTETFEVYKDSLGDHRFRLKAPNGEIIVTGERYATRAATLDGINSVKENCVVPERFETYQDDRGEWRFRLKAANGQIIATGERYSSEDSLANGIKAVTKYALSAEIIVE